MECPRKYFLKKNAYGNFKPSIHLIRGRAVHRTIELFYKLDIHRCVHFDPVDFKRILQDLFILEWKEQEKNLKKLDLTNTELEFFFHDALKMIDNFTTHFYSNKGMEMPSPVIERQLASKSLMLRGRVDAIHFNQKVEVPPLIVDFKTSKSKVITQDHKRQLLIYALLYFENYRIIPDLAIHFLNFKDGVVELKVRPEDLIHVKNLVRDIHDKILSGDMSEYPCTCGKCRREFQLIL